MTKLAERRVDPRHLVDAFWIRGFLQSVKKPGDVTPVGVEVGFHMIDFSVDGYRLQVYEPIHAGDTVLVKFEAIGEWGDFLDVSKDEFAQLGHILNEDNDAQCVGVVTWCEGLNASGGYQAGVHLTEQSLQHRFHSFFGSLMPNAAPRSTPVSFQ